MPIYAIRNTINDKIYVGQTHKTIEERFAKHKKCVKELSCYALYRAMSKYGVDNFYIELVEDCDPELLDEREQFYIENLGTCAPFGYNLTTGGGAGRKVVSEETREKLRQVHLGKPKKPEAIEKTRQAHLGKIISDETRKRLSDSHKGYVMPDSQKEKLRQAGLRRYQRLRESEKNNGI